MVGRRCAEVTHFTRLVECVEVFEDVGASGVHIGEVLISEREFVIGVIEVSY